MKQLTPAEILDVTVNSGVIKATLSIKKMIFLSILAGMFIALAGAGANMVSYGFLQNPDTIGLGKMISGIIFPAGLIMVVLAGSELFTGNCLMAAALLDKKIRLSQMLRNWAIVYAGNLIGSIAIAWIVCESGLLSTGEGLLEATTISIAGSKVNLTFWQAFLRGIPCNFLVCIAVWIANGASCAPGKIVGLFFPIWLFVASGYEHSVANMYFIPAGIFAAGTEGIQTGLTWANFFLNNLIPVTLGNIAGGCIFVAAAYYYSYKKA